MKQSHYRDLYSMCLKILMQFISIKLNSSEMWSFELMVLLSGLLPNPKLQTSVLSIW